MALPSANQKALPIRRPGQRAYWPDLRHNSRKACRLGHIPEQHDPTITCRSQKLAIGRPGHGPHNRPLMLLPVYKGTRAGAHFPDTHLTIVVSGSNELAVRRPGHGIYALEEV